LDNPNSPFNKREANNETAFAQAQADAAARAAAAAQKAQDEADQAFKNTPPYQNYVKSVWSADYDRKYQQWQDHNLTMVNGKLLTPDQVAALNADNQKTYENNRTDQQREDDATDAAANNGGHDRPNGTTGFTPIKATTDGTPPPAMPADYVPPSQRTSADQIPPRLR